MRGTGYILIPELVGRRRETYLKDDLEENILLPMIIPLETIKA